MNGKDKTLSTYPEIEEIDNEPSVLILDNNNVGIIVSMAIHALFIALFLLQPATKVTAIKTFHISFSETISAPAPDIIEKHRASAPPQGANIATAQRPPVVGGVTAKKAVTPPAAPIAKSVETSLPLSEDLPSRKDDGFIATAENLSQPPVTVAETTISKTVPGAVGRESAISSGTAAGKASGNGFGNAAGGGLENASAEGTMSGAGSGAPIDTIFGGKNAPRFIHRAIPIYPLLALRQGKEGRVVLTLLIDKNGKVQNINVTEPAGYGLTETAIEAVKKSTFAPARVNGQKVASRAVLPIRFRIE